MCCSGQCPHEVNDYVNGGTKCRKPKGGMCPGEGNDMIARLDELDKKAAQYADDSTILLEQQWEVLEKIGESASEDERAVLRLRLISLGAAIMILEPLTSDEVMERCQIKKQLCEDK